MAIRAFGSDRGPSFSRLRNMTAIDATGLYAIENLADALHATGRQLVLCDAREQPVKLMERAAFHRHIGDANIQPTLWEGCGGRGRFLRRFAVRKSTAAIT